jgi:hypothetical protein
MGLVGEEPDQPSVEVYPGGRIDPCLVIKSRYGGVYEGGKWLAFPTEAAPDGPSSGDVACIDWFEENSWRVGIGDDPDGAVANLLLKMVDAAAAGRATVVRYDEM